MARRRKGKKKKNNYLINQSLTTGTPQHPLVNWQYHSALIGDKNARINHLNPKNNFRDSLDQKCHGRRLTPEQLIAISHSLLFESAIEKIANTVSRMKWTIIPPTDMDEEETAEKVKIITDTLLQPNFDRHGNYTSIVKAAVRNILVFNVAPIQRQIGHDEHPFWLWSEAPHEVHFYNGWTASVEGVVPRFLIDKTGTGDPNKMIQIMSKNMFLIEGRVSAYEENPPSAVEIAYQYISDWLGLTAFQRRTTSKAVKDYLISLDNEVTNEQFESIKTWWRNEVQGSGEAPIFGGKISVHKFGAKSDEELFLKFKDHVAGLIALVFGLTQRDFNIEMKSGDNRATANVEADQSFQNAMLPLADAIFPTLTNEVIKYYFPGYKIEPNDREYRGEQAESETAIKEYQGGLITLNEARAKVNKDPLEGGDTFLHEKTTFNPLTEV